MLIGYTMRFASVAGIRFCELTFRGLFRLAEHKTWRDLNTLVPQDGDTFASEVICFKSNPLTCTLLAHHDGNYQEPAKF